MNKDKIISETKDLTKTEVRKIVRDEIEKSMSKAKILTKEDVKELVRDMMIKQYKFFWEKRSFWVNNV
jgi:hypothetical protein